jgi:hypothetical protein
MRKKWHVFLLLGAATLLAAAWHWAWTAPSTLRADEQTGEPVASLRDQLEKGLRARRPVEVQFVRRVAQLVDQRQLSLELVQGTFSWTVKKYRTKKYLVPHFEQVLRQRAAKEGITALNNVPTTLPRLD